jgi:uncharacterized protein (DUF2132 family)
MTAHISKDPLHGVTLEMMVNALVARYGWSELGNRIKINCFRNDPSVKSSLKFLRRTPGRARKLKPCISILSVMTPPKNRMFPTLIPGQ